MDKTYVEDNDIAQKYLRGELAPEEAAEFELYFMEDQQMLEQLEIDSALYKHSAGVFGELETPGTRKLTKWSGIFQIACGAALGALLVALLPSILTKEEKMLDTYGIAQIEYIEELRSTSTERVESRSIDLAGETQRVVLAIDTGVITDTLYDVIISRESGDEGSIIRARNVSGSDTGELIIDIPVEIITDEIYSLNIYQSDSRELTKAYLLKFSREE